MLPELVVGVGAAAASHHVAVGGRLLLLLLPPIRAPLPARELE